MDTAKKCSKCQEVKPASEFTPRPNRPGGLYSCCKQCKTAARSRRYRERRVADPLPQWVVLAQNWAKNRAKKTGLQFSLTQEELQGVLARSNLRCTYCDNPFNFQRDIQTRGDSPTIDRIIPSGGYTLNNVVVCCYRCNRIKNDATPDDLVRLSTRVALLIQDRGLQQAAPAG